METTVTVSAPPMVEPVTVALAARHCRIDSAEDNDLLAGHITAARSWAELYLARALITQGLIWTMSDRADHGALPGMPGPFWYAPIAAGLPSRLYRPLELPRAPVQSVASVTTRDFEGNDTILDPAMYSLDLDLQPARLRLCPQIAGGAVRHVKIAFVAGYGDTGASVPVPICQAILLLTAFLYEHRGDAGGEMPTAAEWLLAPYRIAFFGG